MHPIIVKHGSAVIVAFCYNICLFRNPVISISEVVGCKDCVRENYTSSNLFGDVDAKPPAARQFLQFFQKKKIAILTPFGWHFARF